jgi:hypothetical protein
MGPFISVNWGEVHAVALALARREPWVKPGVLEMYQEADDERAAWAEIAIRRRATNGGGTP